MVLVSFDRRRRSSRGGVILPVPRTANFTAPQQLRDQEKGGEDACGATMEHDGV